jgi:hypothetical protein
VDRRSFSGNIPVAPFFVPRRFTLLNEHFWAPRFSGVLPGNYGVLEKIRMDLEDLKASSSDSRAVTCNCSFGL